MDTNDLTIIVAIALSAALVSMSVAALYFQRVRSLTRAVDELQFRFRIRSSQDSEQESYIRRLKDELDLMRSLQPRADEAFGYQPRRQVSDKYLRDLGRNLSELSDFLHSELPQLRSDRVVTNSPELQLDSLMAVYQQISSEFAHSIKTPLATIESALSAVSEYVGATSTMLEVAQDDRGALVASSLENAAIATDSVKEILQRGAGFVPGEPSQFSLSMLCQKAIRMTREANARGANVTLSVEDVPQVTFYQLNLLIALVQVLENALECNADRSEIQVRVEVTNGEVSIYVSNTGEPIPHNAKDRLFESGFSTKGDGRGMGLLLARECMRRVGGDVDFLASDQSATTFRIFFSQTGPESEE